MVADTLVKKVTKLFQCTCGLVLLLLVGCQSTVSKVGQDHARDVLKWQELARFAGKELKHSGLTITAGIQVNKNTEESAYSIVNVRLNRSARNTEVDLLSPEFAEKFACGKVCSNLGLYNKRFDKQETQLRSFFFQEEGRFFDFYGKLSLLNDNLAYYRASSPGVLKKYMNWLLDQKQVFNSLPEIIVYLDASLTEAKLLAFAKSGFTSPDTYMHFLTEEQMDYPPMIDEDDISMPDDHWGLAKSEDELRHERLMSVITQNAPKSEEKLKSWRQAKKKRITIDSIACSYSDNSFGRVKRLKGKKVTLLLMGQAREVVDGVKQHPQPGYLFSAAESFYFAQASGEKVYYQDDIASCDIDYLNKVALSN